MFNQSLETAKVQQSFVLLTFTRRFFGIAGRAGMDWSSDGFNKMRQNVAPLTQLAPIFVLPLHSQFNYQPNQLSS